MNVRSMNNKYYVDFELLESPFQAKEIEGQSLLLPAKKNKNH